MTGWLSSEQRVATSPVSVDAGQEAILFPISAGDCYSGISSIFLCRAAKSDELSGLAAAAYL